MPSLRLAPGRPVKFHDNNNNINFPPTSTPTTTTTTTTITTTTASARARGATAETATTTASSRERHNAMMRDNRGRFNDKFRELTALLTALSSHLVLAGKENSLDIGVVLHHHQKPMKNKIQVLERAMHTYAAMESERAQCKDALLYAPAGANGATTAHTTDIAGFRDTLAATGAPKEACQAVVRSLCAAGAWKYGEVWVNDGDGTCFKLENAFVAPRNMPATRARLVAHARRMRGGEGACCEQMLRRVVKLRHAVWISDVGKRGDGRERREAGISTGVATSVVAGGAERVVVVMHADDELLAFAGGVRPYDAKSVGKITEMGKIVEEIWSRT